MCASDPQDGAPAAPLRAAKGCALLSHPAGLLMLAIVAALAPVANSQAQQQGREQEQIRRLRQQVQQLQQEQSAQQQATQAAQAEKAALRQQLEAAQRDLGRVRAAAGKQTARVGEAEQQVDILRGERSQLQTKVGELEAELQRRGQAIESLRAEVNGGRRTIGFRDNALADLQARHRVQAEGLQTCIASNEALRTLGNELLERWATKGVGQVLAVNEPFLQLRRVELENLVQGYRDKLDQQALKAIATGAGNTAAAPGAGRVP